MRRWRACGVFFATLVLCLTATHSFGQATDSVEVSGFEGHAQEMSNWCWAASIQSLLLTKGLDVSQAAIVTAAYGRPVNARAPGFQGTLALLNRVILTVEGDAWRVSASASTTAPDAHWLLRQLQEDRPVMIWFRDPNEDHSIVLTGGEYYLGPGGSFAGWRRLAAYDPFFNRTMAIDASNIPRYVYGTFMVSIERSAIR